MTKALIVIDIQNDYFPGGKMELVGSVEAAVRASSVQALFREHGYPVLHIKHFALSPNATFFLPNTWGVEINESVAPITAELIIIKHYPNSFRETVLGQILANLQIKDLVVVGMMTHMCIDTSVRAANDLGFNVTLVSDACATKNLNFNGVEIEAAAVQGAYLAAIDGSFAKVVTAAELVELI